MLSFKGLAVVALAFLVQACHQSDDKPFKKRVDEKDFEPCEEFSAKISNQYIQGYVDVPENWEDPSSRKIQVFYYARLDGKKDKDEDNVVFFNGGPVGDSHSSYKVLNPIIEGKNLDFVFLDQRGTGCSTNFPSPNSDAEVLTLANWGSRAIVQDAEAVREKLFGPTSKWKVFGQSYGGLITHRYLETRPQSVVSAHAHGFAYMRNYKQWQKERQLNQKVAGQAFLAAYPEAGPNIARAKAALTKDVCVENAEKKVCDDGILDYFSSFLGWRNQWTSMSNFFSKFVVGNSLNGESLLWLKNAILKSEEKTSGEKWASMVLSMSEVRGSPYDGSGSCEETFSLLRRDGNQMGDWLFSECRYHTNWEMKQGATDSQNISNNIYSRIRHDAIGINKIKENLVQNPNLKFYLYSGRLDTYVPPATFTEEVSFLGNLVEYQEFPNTAHDGFYTETEVWQDLMK